MFSLSSSSSGSVMVYELQTEDVVLYNNQVIGFLISGYHYDSQIKGKYFPIQDYENLKKAHYEVIESDLLTTIDGTIKHDSLKLSSIIFHYLMK